MKNILTVRQAGFVLKPGSRTGLTVSTTNLTLFKTKTDLQFLGLARLSYFPSRHPSKYFQRSVVLGHPCQSPEEKMKLYTDKGNPHTMKVLAASFISDQDVTVEFVKRESEEIAV